MTQKLECGWCGKQFDEGQHFYDDTCNPCARRQGLEVPADWKPTVADPDDWGCDHCRNDGRLENGRCPRCDAEYPDEVAS